MSWARVSMFYLMTYLALGGLGLLVDPPLALRLLGATGDYPPALMRLFGGFMLALAIIVIQIVRLRVAVLHPTTLLVRVVLLGTIVWTYTSTRDPLFLVLSGIVGLGMLLTASGLLADSRAGHRP